MTGVGKLTKRWWQLVLTETVGASNTLDFGDAYLGLLTAAPVVDSSTGEVTVTEVPTSTGGTATGYGRALIGKYGQSETQKFGSPTYDSGTGKTRITNNKEIHFNSVQASWGTISHWAIFNGTGQVLAYGTINDANGDATTDTPAVSNIVFFKAGDIVIEGE